MTDPAVGLEARVAALRSFNRFYTRQIGVLRRRYQDSPFSLGEMRVLYEILHRDHPTATEIARALDLDAGYLSRVLRSFERQDLVARVTSDRDARQSHLALTKKGRATFMPHEKKTQQSMAAMLSPLPVADQERLIAAAKTIEQLLQPQQSSATPYLLRSHRPGDMGWVVSRHGVLYAQEYGWDDRIEALVAEIVAEFIRKYDRKREHCWIAERDGENVGCVFLVKDSERVARLRLFLVDPKARGLGIGRRLTAEAIQFARAAGYRKITLWTHAVLTAARHIYEDAGFTLARTWKHDDFGKKLVAETWDLQL
jgi:DNA-binding MarR family transcriptional regulator/GNAT superfamily N-acetyltransferase